MECTLPKSWSKHTSPIKCVQLYLIQKLSKNNFSSFPVLRPSQRCTRGGRPAHPTLAAALKRGQYFLEVEVDVGNNQYFLPYSHSAFSCWLNWLVIIIYFSVKLIYI